MTTVVASRARECTCTPCHEMKTVMGDLNAKVGSDNTISNRAIGKEGCGSMNNNREAT